MRVFISWSGNDSKLVATLLADWIPNVLQGVSAWISSADIEKGKLWMGDISDTLKETSFGILCLTRENIDAPWILFEAGALSKGLSTSRVCPLLINLTPSDLKPPLASFNATSPTRDDMVKLIKAVNTQAGEKRLEEDRVERSFSRWWTEFEKDFLAIVKQFKQHKEVKHRPVEDMVAEILALSRSIQANVQRGSLQLGVSPEGFMGIDPSLLTVPPPGFFTTAQAVGAPVGLPQMPGRASALLKAIEKAHREKGPEQPEPESLE